MYDFTEIKCDICTKPYPHQIIFRNKIRNLLDIDFDYSKYFLLVESYDIEDETKLLKKYVIYPQEELESIRFAVGRNKRSSMNFTDTSVSRNHACL